MNLQDVIEILGDNWENYRKSFLEGLENDNPLLQRINRYLYDNRGKQLRPVLSLLAAQSCGTPNEVSWSCAAVSEMIHTATLLHDDVVDNSDMRRGALTVKAFFSPAASVLTGDFWLSRALYMLTQSGSNILNCFTFALEELADGELFQMQKADTLDISEEDYYKIIYKKTASLFIAALKSAVFSVNGMDNEQKLITDYGYELGVAFQIRDDIFDYSPSIDTGKPYGEDIRERKITLPLIEAFGVAGAEERMNIINLLLSTSFGNKETEDNLVNRVFSFVEQYDGIASAEKKLAGHSIKAVGLVNSLQAELERRLGSLSAAQIEALEALRVLAVFVGKRKS